MSNVNLILPNENGYKRDTLPDYTSHDPKKEIKTSEKLHVLDTKTKVSWEVKFYIIIYFLFTSRIDRLGTLCTSTKLLHGPSSASVIPLTESDTVTVIPLDRVRFDRLSSTILSPPWLLHHLLATLRLGSFLTERVNSKTWFSDSGLNLTFLTFMLPTAFSSSSWNSRKSQNWETYILLVIRKKEKWFTAIALPQQHSLRMHACTLPSPAVKVSAKKD